MAETLNPAPEQQPNQYIMPTTLDELANMATVDSMRTLVDVLGTPADELSQPEDLKTAMMTTTQTVGTRDNDGEIPPFSDIVHNV